MTRLITDWIDTMEQELPSYDRQIKNVTGMGLTALAAKSAGITEEDLTEMLKAHCGAAIRITSGEGVIDSFAEAVAAILEHMGLPVSIPSAADVDGIHEAVQSGADLLFMADERRFLALDVRTGRSAENDFATALGYVTGLEAMAGGLQGKEILLMGCGTVGGIALNLLESRGANVSLYDKEMEKAVVLSGSKRRILKDKCEIKDFQYLFDATSEGGWLGEEDLHSRALLAALGIPLSLTSTACEALTGRVMHDPLQTGTAVMLSLVCCPAQSI